MDREKCISSYEYGHNDFAGCPNSAFANSDYCQECLMDDPALDYDAAVELATQPYVKALREIRSVFRTEEEYQMGINPWAIANQMAEIAEKALGYPVYGTPSNNRLQPTAFGVGTQAQFPLLGGSQADESSAKHGGG